MRNHKRGWRTERTRYVLNNMVPTFNSGYVSLSAWEMFSSRVRTRLVRICGTLNRDKYITILKNHVLLFKKHYYSSLIGFIYQHDGCGPHRAKSVATFMDRGNWKCFLVQRKARIWILLNMCGHWWNTSWGNELGILQTQTHCFRS